MKKLENAMTRKPIQANQSKSERYFVFCAQADHQFSAHFESTDKQPKVCKIKIFEVVGRDS